MIYNITITTRKLLDYNKETKLVKKVAREVITVNEHRLWINLRQTYYLITQLEENMSGNGITSQQFTVLWAVECARKLTNKPVIMTDIAPGLFRTITSISRIIDRMEKKGLVKRERDMPDRRAIRVEMTPKGEKKYKEVLRQFKKLMKKLLSVYTEEELGALVLQLEKLKKKAQEEPSIKGHTTDIALSNPRKIVKFLNEVV
jgi:DNA-binding MarR family transcriptional regulator